MHNKIRHSLILLLAICHLPFAIAPVARAQFATPIDTNTPSTNTYSLNYQAWSPGLFTNVAMSLLNTQYIVTGDAPAVIARKVNDGFTNIWLWSVGQSNFVVGLSNRVTATNAALSNTLYPLASNFVTLSNTVAAGGGGGSATLPTNLIYAVQTVQTYTTNYAYWTGSNFLARVSGLFSWKLNGGDDGAACAGGAPPGVVPAYLVGSLSGTNAWFPLTNGFTTSNTISVSCISSNLSYFGCPLVDPGLAQLFTLSDWSHYGQYGVAQNLPSLASTNYVNSAIANIAAIYVTSTSNGVAHSTYTVSGQPIFDTVQTTAYVPIVWTGIDGTGTNFLISVSATNLPSGWTLQTTTNLALAYSWQTTTNYSTNIVTGTNTISTPINPTTVAAFFRVLSAQSSAFTIYPPLTLNGGAIYPSNTWNLNTITSAMANFSFWTGNSNGCALVTLSLSNGVVRYVQSLH